MEPMAIDSLSCHPRTVIVAQLAFIGDMVFTTPLLSQIAATWPAARIIVTGRPGALEVLEDDPRFAALIPYDKDGADRGASGLWRVSRKLAAFDPDLFLGVSRSGRTALLGLLTRAPLRVGFSEPGRHWAYHRQIQRNDRERKFPERPLALLEPLGIPIRPRAMDLKVSEDRRRVAREGLVAAGWNGEPLLGIAPGAHYATKRWPEAHWARFLALVQEKTSLRPALYGGPAEEALIERLLAGAPKALDRRGIGIRGVMADLTWAALYVGGDSGPAQMARALSIPTVVLHGPTDPVPLADGRPYTVLSLGLDCQPCSTSGDPACPLGHHRCLTGLLPEKVLAALPRSFST